MKIIFFTKGDRSVGSSRYRAYLIAESLNNQKIQTELIPSTKVQNLPIIDSLKYILKILMSLNTEDVVLCQRAISPFHLPLLLVIFKFIKGYKLVFDMDDASYIYWPGMYSLLTKMSDLVIVGSDEIYSYAIKKNKNVVKIPTVVDIKDYKLKSNYNSKIINIGWIGTGPAHYENLKILSEPIRQISNKYKDKVHFTFVGTLGDNKVERLISHKFGLEPSQLTIIESLDWSKISNIATEINKFDIGIMPLEDDVFSRGKCAFKLIEYMACGVPVVASSVGENVNLIKHNINGLLAKSSKHWVDNLDSLIQDESKRKELGKNGYKTVNAEYSIEKIYPEYKKLFGI